MTIAAGSGRTDATVQGGAVVSTRTTLDYFVQATDDITAIASPDLPSPGEQHPATSSLVVTGYRAVSPVAGVSDTWRVTVEYGRPGNIGRIETANIQDPDYYTVNTSTARESIQIPIVTGAIFDIVDDTGAVTDQTDLIWQDVVYQSIPLNVTRYRIEASVASDTWNPSLLPIIQSQVGKRFRFRGQEVVMTGFDSTLTTYEQRRLVTYSFERESSFPGLPGTTTARSLVREVPPLLGVGDRHFVVIDAQGEPIIQISDPPQFGSSGVLIGIVTQGDIT